MADGAIGSNANHIVLLVAVIAVWLATWIIALVSIGSARVPIATTTRAIWIALAFVFPVVGPVLWFVIGRPYLLAKAQR